MIIKEIAKYFVISIQNIYYRYKYLQFTRRFPLQILTDEETVDVILNSRKSVSRFGDGEFKVIFGAGNGFQKPNEVLGKRLYEVLTSNMDNVLICIPRVLLSTEYCTADAANFWHHHVIINRNQWSSILSPSKTYGQASFTRFYMDYKDKSNSPKLFAHIKKIWDRKNILIVEGEHSCLGVGNDLFDNATSVKRLICPSQNAFDKYEEILSATLRFAKEDDLVLIALGMTATVLAFDLSKYNIQAIDIGHIDIEYEWMKMGTLEKCPVNGKAVQEVGYLPEDNFENQVYRNSIVYEVK